RFGGKRGHHVAMCFGQPADESLALTFRHRDHEPRCIVWRLAGGEDHLGEAPAQETAEIQPSAAGELIELERAELGQGLLFGQLSRDETAKDVSHSPASTSRMRCQCVPAQYT